MTDDRLETLIAEWLVRPSVFMGGPPPGARRRARDLIDKLRHEGYVVIKSKGE